MNPAGTAADAVATALLVAGTAAAVLGGVLLPFTRGAARRLHAAMPVTLPAAPLLAAGLALRTWPSWHEVAKLAVIALLLALTGPATVIAAARALRTPWDRDRPAEPGHPRDRSLP